MANHWGRARSRMCLLSLYLKSLAVATLRLFETRVFQTRGAYRLVTVSRAFFLRGKSRKFDVTFFPGFFTRLSLRAADKLEQTTSSPDEIDVVARSKIFGRRQKTCRVACVQNLLPFEMFLPR